MIGRRDVLEADRGAEKLGAGNEDAHGLGKPERREREIGALEPQRRDADERARERRDQHRGRQREPERKAELGRDHRRRIGADRHQGDMADRHLAGEAFHDVQADRQDDVDRHHVDDELRVGVVEKQRQRQQQRRRRSATARSGASDPRAGAGRGRWPQRSSLMCRHGALCPPRATVRLGCDQARRPPARRSAVAASQSAGTASEAEVGLERHACQHARVEVLAALGVLDQDAGPVAVAALRRRSRRRS